MASGIFGTNIPAFLGTEGITNYVDIYYCYSATRNSNDMDKASFTKLDEENLSEVRIQIDDSSDVVEGMYSLKLPSTIFGSKGYYTIYIKPKEVPATILYVSKLKNFVGIRGIVLDGNSLPNQVKVDALTNNSMVGYRVIYLDGNGTRSGDVRIVTSNNKCKPVVSTSTDDNAKTISFEYNENSSLVFLTLSPSMPLNFQTSSIPFIGYENQNILLVNTLFEPVCIELEMVENDADTIATMISGSQLRDLNKGLITTFNEQGEIFMQHELSSLKSTETGTPQFEIKEKRTDNIDYSQTLNNLV